MARLPGALGLQQFGIGLFVKAGDAGQVTTPDNWGTAEGENVTRLERVVYDQTSSPIFISTAGISSRLASAHGETDIVTSRVVYDQTSAPVFLRGAQQPYPAFLEVAANLIRRAVVGSLTAFAAASAMAEPVFVPQVRTAAIAPSDVAAKAKKIRLPDSYAEAVTVPPVAAVPVVPFNDDAGAAARTRRINLPDGTVVAVTVPPAVTPSAFAYQPVEAVWRVQKKLLPDGFTSQFRILAVTPDIFGYQPVDATWRQQRKVLPDGIAVPLTAPAAARPIAPSDAVARARKINLPDGYAAPISPPAVVPAAVVTGALANSLTIVRTSVTVLGQTSTPGFLPAVTGTPVELRFVPDNSLTVVRTVCVVLDQTSTPVFPPVVTGTPVELRWIPSNSLTVVRTVCVVLDQISTPGFPPEAGPGGGGSGVELHFVPKIWDDPPARQRIKPVPLSAFVFAYPIDDLATNDGYEDAFVRIIRAKRKILPDGIAQPPFQPVAVTPPTVSPLACAYSSATVVLSRVVYDQGAARPVFPPVVVVVPPTFYQADEGAPQRRVSRPGIKLDLEGFERPTTQQQTLFWFETYPAVRTAPISARAVKSNLDGLDRPLIQITVTPSYLFEAIAPPWTAKPNAVAIKADLDGIQRPDQLPAPPTSTPANLFDNIGPVARTLPNRVAIKTDLDGAIWPPQQPEDLTGVIFVPPTPPQLQPYPIGGDYWHRTHKKKGKTSKRCRFITIDGVLTWICGRLTSDRIAEARLQALDLVYDAAGGDLKPLYDTLRVEEATNANEAKRNAATLLLRAIRETRRLEVETKSVDARRVADAAAQKAAAAANKAAIQAAVAQEAARYEAAVVNELGRRAAARATAAAQKKALHEAALAAEAQRRAEEVQRQADEAERRAELARAELIQAAAELAEQARLAAIDEEDDDLLLLD